MCAMDGDAENIYENSPNACYENLYMNASPANANCDRVYTNTSPVKGEL